MLNALVYFSVELQPLEAVDPRDDVLACATEVRRSLGKLKDPKLITALAAEIGKIQSQSAWDRSIHIMDWNDGALYLNNTRRWVSRCSDMSRG